jgi:hypothetical protein
MTDYINYRVRFNIQDTFLGGDITNNGRTLCGRGVKRGEVAAWGDNGPDTTSLSQE